MPSWADFTQVNDIALRLPLSFDGERLAADLARMPDDWWHRHLGPYHDGNWEGISLWAPGGRRDNQFSHGGAYAATEAIGLCQYVPAVLSQFSSPLQRVRFLRLRAGGLIHPHSDPIHQLHPDLVRLHIPVKTNPDVDFRVRGERLRMDVGEVWFVDVRFKHQVSNRGSGDRVHLVVDLQKNAQLCALMDGAWSAGTGRLTAYYAKHSLPNRLIRILNIGN